MTTMSRLINLECIIKSAASRASASQNNVSYFGVSAFESEYL